MKKTGQLAKSMDITIIRDVPYATQSEAQKLDIYMLTKRRETQSGHHVDASRRLSRRGQRWQFHLRH